MRYIHNGSPHPPLKSLIEQEAPLTVPANLNFNTKTISGEVKYWIGKTLYQSEGMHDLVAHLSFLRRGAHLCAINPYSRIRKGTLLDLVG